MSAPLRRATDNQAVDPTQTRVRIDGYPHRLAGHCGSGALRDLMVWAGLGWDGPVSEGLVFGLGGALAFIHLRVPDLQPPVYVVGRNLDLEPGVCARVGIATQRHQTGDPGQGWRWVVDELDAGRPAMIQADIAHLPYLRVRLSNTRHVIVVVGYDLDRQVAWVVDNDRAEVQEVTLEALAAARRAVGFPDPVRHATWPLRFPDRLPDLLPVARDAARASVRSMRERTGDLFDPAASASEAVTGSGLDGVQTFAQEVAGWSHTLSPDSRRAAVAALAVFIDKAGTGGALFRGLQTEFCGQVARLTDDPAFAAAADAYRGCADAWTRLAQACRDRPDDHALIAEQAARLPDLERWATDALARAGADPR